MSLNGRVALVTGSSRGIGRAIALALAAKGASVAINCRVSRQEALEVVREVKQIGRRAIAVIADVTDAAQVDGLVRDTESWLGPVDILVNNAVYALQKPFLDITQEEWVSQVQYKALGYFLTAQRVLPGMLQKKNGVIINVLSTAGVRGGEGEAGYAAANGAAMALTRAIANEFGRDGIRCCGVMTAWADNAFDAGDPECTKHLNRFSLGRVVRVGEVASVVAFLASDEASGITGSFVTCDAGFLSRW